MKTVLRPTLDAAFRLGWFWGENNGWASRVQAQGALLTAGLENSEHNVFAFIEGAEDGRKGDNRRMMRRKMNPRPTWGLAIYAGGLAMAEVTHSDDGRTRSKHGGLRDCLRWVAACLSNAGREFAEREGYIKPEDK